MMLSSSSAGGRLSRMRPSWLASSMPRNSRPSSSSSRPPATGANSSRRPRSKVDADRRSSPPLLPRLRRLRRCSPPSVERRDAEPSRLPSAADEVPRESRLRPSPPRRRRRRRPPDSPPSRPSVLAVPDDSPVPSVPDRLPSCREASARPESVGLAGDRTPYPDGSGSSSKSPSSRAGTLPSRSDCAPAPTSPSRSPRPRRLPPRRPRRLRRRGAPSASRSPSPAGSRRWPPSSSPTDSRGRLARSAASPDCSVDGRSKSS